MNELEETSVLLDRVDLPRNAVTLQPVTSVGATLFSHLEVPFVHKWLILAFAILGVVLAWLAISVLPRTYVSEAQLMIRVGRESVALDPTATTSEQTMMIQKTRNEEVISALGVLSSRQVKDGVVKQLGAGPILSGRLPGGQEPEDEPSGLKATLASAKEHVSDALDLVLVSTGLRDEVSDEELAVMRLDSNVDIHAVRDSAVLSISAYAKSPKMAQAIAKSITETFVDQHMAVTRTPGSFTFFDRQVREVEEKLNNLVEERTEFLTSKNLISIDANRQVLTNDLGAISAEILAAEGKLQQAIAQFSSTAAARDLIPEEIVASKVERDNTTFNAMRAQLVDLEVKEKKFSEVLSPGHPRLMTLQSQIAEIRSMVSEVDSGKTDSSMTPNPERQRVEASLQISKTNAAGLESLIAEKEKQREEIKTEVERLLADEKNLLKMDRDIALLESSLNSLQIKLESSRVIDQMGKDRISNVSVFQPATFIERPVSPKKRVLAVLIPALSMMVGFAFAYVREANSSSLRTVDHVTQQLGEDNVVPLAKTWRLSNPRANYRLQKPSELVCQSLLAELLLSREWGDNRVLGVIGTHRGSGASTIAAQLAVVCESCGISTTLVDGDARNRTVSKTFRVGKQDGLTEFATGQSELKDCVVKKSDKLALMPFSSPSKKVRLNGDFESITASLQELQTQSDVLIVDLPSASESPEAVALARKLDYVIVVLESEKTTRDDAMKLMRHLTVGDSQVLGVVLNKTKQHMPRWMQRMVRGRVA